jgi:hypothetical protein
VLSSVQGTGDADTDRINRILSLQELIVYPN